MPLTSSPNSFPNTSNLGLSHFLYNSELLLAIQLSPSDLNRIGIGLGALFIYFGVPQKIIRSCFDEDGKQRMEIIDANNPGKNISKVKKQRLEDNFYTGTTFFCALMVGCRARHNIKRNVRDKDRNNPIDHDEILQTLQSYGIAGLILLILGVYTVYYFKNPPFGGTEEESEKKK